MITSPYPCSPRNKYSFSAAKIKQSFINVLSSYFEERGHSLIYEKSDGDTLVVKVALNIAEEQHAIILTNATDILILFSTILRKIFSRSLPQAVIERYSSDAGINLDKKKLEILYFSFMR